MKRNDRYRVLAVLRPRGDSNLDGGSSTVDRRLVEVARRPEDGRSEKKRKGGAR